MNIATKNEKQSTTGEVTVIDYDNEDNEYNDEIDDICIDDEYDE